MQRRNIITIILIALAFLGLRLSGGFLGTGSDKPASPAEKENTPLTIPEDVPNDDEVQQRVVSPDKSKLRQQLKDNIFGASQRTDPEGVDSENRDSTELGGLDEIERAVGLR